jgi:phospholipid/cholesterol/gamma-HCH transport system substrate-binding protein
VNEERRDRAMSLRVGVFVLVALAAFLGLIYALGARTRIFEPRYTIHAEFTEVGGLAEGATVRLAGVQIGRVAEVTLPAEPGGKVRVDLNIARRYADRVRRDSVARIETQGLLGDKIVEITVGSARAPALQAGETIATRDPANLADAISSGAETMKNVAAVAESVLRTAESFNQTRIVEDVAAASATARQAAEQFARITAQVEKGRGWAHALIYEEPLALRRLNETLAATQSLLDRLERGEGVVGVLTSARSTEAARKLVQAMERIGQLPERSAEDAGILPALLFDPKYRGLLEDLSVVARNFREVSDRVAGGRGTLGSLVRDTSGDGALGLALEDLQVATANLRAITTRINEGEGTLGALIADPTVYDRLVTILDGVQRSFLLRSLIRGLDKESGRKE